MDGSGFVERRQGERRQGERRSALRDSPDRRSGERRAVSAGMAAVFLMAAAPSARADVYVRRNPKGILEATNLPGRDGFELKYRSKGTLIHSAGFRLRPSTRSEYNHHIEAASRLYGVDVNLVRAVIQVESEFDFRAVSTAGAQGLMQLMPFTAKRFGVANPFDPRQNIFGGVQYLRWLLDQFNGDVVLACAGYNAGERAVWRYGGVPPYRETQNYVRKIQALLQHSGWPEAPVVTVASSAPLSSVPPAAAPAAASVPAAAKPAKPSPPKVLYRWTDARGVLHMAETPPGGGAAYTKVVRSAD
jgi:soluble lytic murein transglycosylase